MNEERYRKGKVVFQEGDPGDCLYYIRWGTVGVYSQYGTKGQRKLAELRTGDYFGEMGLLDHEPRSATVVSLDHDTTLDRISEDEFARFLEERPAKVMDILRRLSHKLRDTTKGYLRLCQAIDDSVGPHTEVVGETGSYGFDRDDRLRVAHDAMSEKA